MIFSWEFSKLLESIIFRNIFICVKKLNYIKNYMKTRRETRRGGQPSPYFSLRKKTVHLNYTRRRRSVQYERFIKTFLKRDQDRLNWKFFCDNKTTLFSSFRFFYLFCVYQGIPFSDMFSSFLVCRKNLGQFLLRQTFVNHPTMTVKNLEFFILEAQETFPGTLKVNMMNVLYCFVIYRLYLNYNAKIIYDELFVIWLIALILQ